MTTPLKSEQYPFRSLFSTLFSASANFLRSLRGPWGKPAPYSDTSREAAGGRRTLQLCHSLYRTLELLSPFSVLLSPHSLRRSLPELCIASAGVPRNLFLGTST